MKSPEDFMKQNWGITLRPTGSSNLTKKIGRRFCIPSLPCPKDLFYINCFIDYLDTYIDTKETVEQTSKTGENEINRRMQTNIEHAQIYWNNFIKKEVSKKLVVFLRPSHTLAKVQFPYIRSLGPNVKSSSNFISHFTLRAKGNSPILSSNWITESD